MNRSVFIGREAEVASLKQYAESAESEFVVIYGRRRVGKTFLVKEFFNDSFDFKVTGMYKQSGKVQLKNFLLALKEYGAEWKQAPTDWLEAFAELKKLLKNIPFSGRKKVIFMDELPWMDTPKSGFLAAFEAFWNGWGAQQDDILLIVCGSATTWISQKLLQNTGGLFNRATRRIYLLPFTLAETEKFLLSRGFQWSRYEIVQAYMAMGGIPYYLKLLDGTLPLSSNMDQIFFNRKGPLWNEFSVLYETLFGRSELYLKIIRALSGKLSGLKKQEIASIADIPQNGAFSQALKNLTDCDFVREYNTFGLKNNDRVYQLCDYYTLFYFRFLHDNAQFDEQYWTHTLDNPARHVWAGYTFEQVCKDHISQIRKSLGISGILTSLSSWSGQYEGSKAQIDLIIDRRDPVIQICEAKYSVNEFVIDKEYEEKLRNKLFVFKGATGTKKALQLVMITTYGVKQNIHSGIVSSQLTLDNLFE